MQCPEVLGWYLLGPQMDKIPCKAPKDRPGVLLLIWINFNPIDKYILEESMGWNNFSILKLQQLHRLSLGMDK